MGRGGVERSPAVPASNDRMLKSVGLLEALSWLAHDVWVWPGWLAALGASIQVWRRTRRVLAIHLLIVGWHATCLSSIIEFWTGLSSMG